MTALSLLLFPALPAAAGQNTAITGAIREFDRASYRVYASTDGQENTAIDAASYDKTLRSPATEAYTPDGDLDSDTLLWIIIGAGAFLAGTLLVMALGS